MHLTMLYIDALTTPFLITGTNYIAVGGDFNQIRNTSAALSAEC